MNIVQILLFILLAAFPLGQVGRISLQEGSINIIPLDMAVFLVILGWLFTKRIELKGSLSKSLLLFFGAAIFSLLTNAKNLLLSEVLISSLYFVRFCFYTSLYLVINEQTLAFKKRFTFGLLLAGFLVVLIGIMQYFFYPDLRNLYYAGWDEHLYRVFSTFLDPNFAGAFFVLELILISTFLFQDAAKKNWQKFGLFFMASLTFASLLLTYSRGAFIMLTISTIAFFIMIKQVRYIMFLIILFAVGILLLPKNLESEGVNLFRTASIVARSKEMEHALTIVKDNFLLGVGFNAYRFAKRNYGFLDKDAWQMIHSGGGTDNSFLFVLATTGIIGFSLYLFLLNNILTLGRNSFAIKDRFFKSLGIILFCGTLGLIVDSFFVNSLFYPHLLAWLFLVAGITEKE